MTHRWFALAVGAGVIASTLAAEGAVSQTTPPASVPAAPDAVDSTRGRSPDASPDSVRRPASEADADIAAGDRQRAAMHADSALAAYQAALAVDSTVYEALYKASREAVDLGEFEPDDARRKADFSSALAYARRAAAVNPAGADGHFAIARALGRQALSVGGKARIRYAKEVRIEALEALRADSNHAGALHVMGVWNAEVMRLGGLERFIARNLLGGGILGTASWQEAIRYMERSVVVEPQRIVHHLDLGKIYADRGDVAKAREQFQIVVSSTPAEYNDPHYQDDARHRLARL